MISLNQKTFFCVKGILSEAQADVMDVARLLARDKIRTVIINTSHNLIEAARDKEYRLSFTQKLYAPTELLMELSRVTDGSYYGLALKTGDETPIQTRKRRLYGWFSFEDEVEIA